jgi:hypothetical protein
MIQHLARRVAWLAPLVLLLALAGCGTQGAAPTLGKAATATFGGALPGSLTLTPIASTHVVVYYLGKLIPYAGATTPVELRQGSCDGKVIAALTEATAAPPPAGAAPVAQAGDGAKGVDVAAVVDVNVYVVILAHANDPNAAQLACGAPLNDKRQFFDLFTPGQGPNGAQLGLALIEPQVATRAQVRLSAPAPAALTWSVYGSGACTGTPLAQGQIAQGGASGASVIFAATPASGWSVALAPTGASSPDACQKTGANG